MKEFFPGSNSTPVRSSKSGTSMLKGHQVVIPLEFVSIRILRICLMMANFLLLKLSVRSKCSPYKHPYQMPIEVTRRFAVGSGP